MISTSVRSISAAMNLSGANTANRLKQTGKSDFQEVLNNQTSKNSSDENVQNLQKDSSLKPNKEEPMSQEIEETTSEPVQVQKDTKPADISEEEPISEEKLEQVMEVLNTASTQMIQQIADTFGISVEEVQDIMAQMGMEPLDVMNPEQLSSLLLKLGGAETSFDLLTNENLYNQFQTLMNSQKELLNECSETLDMDTAQAFVIAKESVMEVDISVATQDTNFVNIESEDTEFVDTDFEDTEFINTEFEDTDFVNTEFEDTNFIEADTDTVIEMNNSEITNMDEQNQVLNMETEDVQMVNSAESQQNVKSTDVLQSTEGKTKDTAVFTEIVDEQQLADTEEVFVEVADTDEAAESTNTKQSTDAKAFMEVTDTKQSVNQFTTVQNESAPRQSDEKTSSQEQQTEPFFMNFKTNNFALDFQQVAESSTVWDTDTQDIMRQIMDYMKIQVKPGMSDIEMQLHPESLGTVHVQIASKGGVITAQFTTQNEAVKNVLESQMIQLKENFEQQGIKVEAVEVTVQTHEFEQNLEQGRGRQQNETEKKGRTRRINLNMPWTEEDLLNQSEEEKLAAEMMAANGSIVVDYMA